jgi:small subunit ribosomal protein S9
MNNLKSMPSKETTKETVKKPIVKKVAKPIATHVADKPVVRHAEPAHPAHKERYIEAVGRRKTAVARVRITVGHSGFIVNGKDVKNYFQVPHISDTAAAPFLKLKLEEKFGVTAHVHGGGVAAQAEAVRLGLSRALALKNPDLLKRLHGLGFMTRDPRMVERKKYGLKKARRAPQWAKR